MRTLLVAVAALIPASLTLLPGCPLGCGAWDGKGDTMLRSDQGESVMLCANGGYAAVLSTGESEGVFQWNDTINASSPDSGARTFSFEIDGAGGFRSSELAGTWTEAVLDKVELDHAHVQCADLETRAWWGTGNQNVFLPKATAFKKVAAGFATADACFEAQARGEYPEAALCEDELLACPDGRAMLSQGQSFSIGSYSAMYGTINVNPAAGSFFASFEGVYSAQGSLTTHDVFDTAGTTKATWRQVPVSEMSNGAACQ